MFSALEDTLGTGSGKRGREGKVGPAVTSATEASWHMLAARNWLLSGPYEDDVCHWLGSGGVWWPAGPW
jgi:hypothetical protein